MLLLPQIPDGVSPLKSTAVARLSGPGTPGDRGGWLFLFPDRFVFVAGPGNVLGYSTQLSMFWSKGRYEKRARQRGKDVVEIPLADISTVTSVRVGLMADNAVFETRSGKRCFPGGKLAKWALPIRSALAANGIEFTDVERGFHVGAP